MTAILTVSELFWPEGGGAEYATYLILQLLAKRNYEITVLTSTKHPAKIPGVRYHITPLLKPANRITRWTLIKTLAKTLHFKQLLKQHDILYIPQAAYPLIPDAKKAGLRVIVHLHNYMPIRYHGIKYYFEPDVEPLYDELKLAIMHEYYIQKSFTRTLLAPLSYALYFYGKSWITQADAIICVSKRQMELIITSMPQIRDKIQVVYNPLPPHMVIIEPQKQLSDMPTFLYVGGDSYIKGFFHVLYLVKYLAKQNVKARFILTNNYSPKALQLLRTITQNSGSIEVEVRGRITYQELINSLLETWALLFPSIWEEPLPYAVVEAGLTATVPIATSVGGVPEILKETPAEQFLFTPGDLEQFAERVEHLLIHTPREILRMGVEIRNKLKHIFNTETIESKIVGSFKNT